MDNVVGLFDRQAERIARRELPSLADAEAILSAFLTSGGSMVDVMNLARRGHADPESMSPEEFDIVLAYVRARAGQ